MLADRYKNNTGIASIGDAGVVFVTVGKQDIICGCQALSVR